MRDIEILPVADRKDLIEQALKSPLRVSPTRFRSKLVDLPVVNLPVELPLYRLQNGRTSVTQIALIHDLKLPADFFQSGQENLDAQREQHKILLNLAKEPTANIYEGLARDKEQTEDLALSAEGVVINGNRRLAAMRELHSQHPKTYGSFGWVNAVIFPVNATPKDFIDYETTTQLRSSLRLDYGWVETALDLRNQRVSLGYTLEEIVSLWSLKPSEVDKILGCLDLAEGYLDYIRKTDEYKLLAQQEQAFSTLYDKVTRPGLAPDDAQSLRLLAFAFIKDGKKSLGRVYDVMAKMPDIAPRVAPTIAELAVPSAVKAPPSGNDPLDSFREDSDKSRASSMNYLANSDNAPVVADLVGEAFGDMRWEKTEASKTERLRVMVNKLHGLSSDLKEDKEAINAASPESAQAAVDTLLKSLENTLAALHAIQRRHPSSRRVNMKDLAQRMAGWK